MPTFTLNGETIPYQNGDTIIRAAWRAGVEIPHYCWHPGLSTAANCRMCLVHIKSGRQMAMPIMKYDAKKKAYVPDTKPKLFPACQMSPSPGMEVDSISEDVQKAQAHVQEFLLLNHPVDCPICDQAGECKLQDYHEAHLNSAKRKRTEPVHKPKGVRFGPTIVYDAERCISCTRCVRFCDEVVGDPVLDSRERGNRCEIIVSPGRELDHDYTLMTEHVCPVGALTSRDFRFKARVWFLKSADGVCNGCAKGCNSHVDYDPRYGKVYRLRPRDSKINDFWMCDHGMLSYQSQTEARITVPVAGRGEEADTLLHEEIVDEVSSRLATKNASKVAFVLNATATTEDNFALARFAELLGSNRIYLAARNAEAEGWYADEILRHEDPNPNRAGALRAAGRDITETVEDLVSDVLSGDVEAVVALGPECGLTTDALSALEKLEDVICLTSNEGALASVASVQVPVAHWAEVFGTYSNYEGKEQSFFRAVPPPEGVVPAWEQISQIARAMGLDLPFEKTGEVRSAFAKARPVATPEAAQPAQGA